MSIIDADARNLIVENKQSEIEYKEQCFEAEITKALKEKDSQAALSAIFSNRPASQKNMMVQLAFSYAVKLNKLPEVEFLIQQGADIDLFQGFGKGRLKLKYSYKPAEQENLERNALWYAVEEGTAEMVELLLKKGADTDFGQCDEDTFDIVRLDYSAFMEAVLSGRFDILKLIFKYRIKDLGMEDLGIQLALAAGMMGNLEMVDFINLFQNRFKLKDEKNTFFYSKFSDELTVCSEEYTHEYAFIGAVIGGHFHIIRHLAARYKNIYESTPMAFKMAAYLNKIEMLQFLYNKNPDYLNSGSECDPTNDLVENEPATALQFVCSRYDNPEGIKTAKLLIKLGANFVPIEDAWYETQLAEAAGNNELAQFLGEYTKLLDAAKAGDEDETIVRSLEEGLSPCIQDDRGNGLLHRALGNGKIQTAFLIWKFLINHEEYDFNLTTTRNEEEEDVIEYAIMEIDKAISEDDEQNSKIINQPRQIELKLSELADFFIKCINYLNGFGEYELFKDTRSSRLKEIFSKIYRIKPYAKQMGFDWDFERFIDKIAVETDFAKFFVYYPNISYLVDFKKRLALMNPKEDFLMKKISLETYELYSKAKILMEVFIKNVCQEFSPLLFSISTPLSLRETKEMEKEPKDEKKEFKKPI